MPEPVWIVHPDAEARALLRRLAGDPSGAEGAPADIPIDDAPAPAAVVLYVGPDPSVALDFAHRTSLRHPRAGFVLLRDERLPAAALATAFAGLRAEALAWPSEAERLPEALARAGGAGPTGLRARRERDVLVRRFARMLGDLDLPDLSGLRAGRIVVRGEPGTGRLLVARLVHALADPPGALVQLDCAGEQRLRELAARLEAAAGAERAVVCLERVERLRADEQRELASWIELGPPGLALDPERSVWIAIVSELAGAVPLLEPALAQALAGLEIALPPLRRRPGAAERFAVPTLRALAAATGAPARELSREAAERIAHAPWPGNFRELEAALRRAVAKGGEGPLGPGELGLEARLPPAAPPAPAPAARPPRAPLREPAVAPPAPTAAAPSAAKPAPPPAPAAPAPAPGALLQALAHSLRNPLVSLKTFATLLPERWADEEFRVRFRAQAERDLANLERHLDRLAHFAELMTGERKPVNVAALLEALLHERRAEIRTRRLLVLSELGADAPWALGSEETLRFAFAALFDATFARIGDRQDLYIACRRPAAQAGRPGMLRILLRFHGAPLAELPGAEAPAALELVLAEAVFEAFGGRLGHESLDSGEQVVRVDLPAASAES